MHDYELLSIKDFESIGEMFTRFVDFKLWKRPIPK